MTTREWFAGAPPLPFVPFNEGTRTELRRIAGRKSRTNRKRNPRRPPLALALVGLVSSTAALLATSRDGEECMTASVPVIRQAAEQVKSAVFGSSSLDRGLCGVPSGKN